VFFHTGSGVKETFSINFAENVHQNMKDLVMKNSNTIDIKYFCGCVILWQVQLAFSVSNY